MRPGPTEIRRCEHCGSHFARPTLASGNTIGARSWTDGWTFAPMLPRRHRLVRCPTCTGLVWVARQEVVSVVRGRLDDDPEHAGVERMKRPSVAQYLAYLDAHPDLSAADEGYVRRHVWWFENHARRDAPDPPPLAAHERVNLLALAALIEPAAQASRLELAEIHRELGELDRASMFLADPFEESLGDVAKQLRELVADRVLAVRRLHFEDSPRRARSAAPSPPESRQGSARRLHFEDSPRRARPAASSPPEPCEGSARRPRHEHAPMAERARAALRDYTAIKPTRPPFGSPASRRLFQAERSLDGIGFLSTNERILFSDGRNIHFRGDRNPVAVFEDETVCAALRSRDLTPETCVLAPFGGLKGAFSLWLLRGYARDSSFRAVPLMFDAESAFCWPLLPSGCEDMGGTEPRRIVRTQTPGEWAIVGEVDAGAMFHIDKFIPVARAYRLHPMEARYTFASDIEIAPGLPYRVITAGGVADEEAGLAYPRHVRTNEEGDAILLEGRAPVPYPGTRPFDREAARRRLVLWARGRELWVLDLRGEERAELFSWVLEE